jgi:DNA-binding PadR family transcriptional regulator
MAIGKYIRHTSEEVLLVEHGSLYPALQRLERDRLITSKWETNARGRDIKFHRLTPPGRERLTLEESRWKQVVRARARMSQPLRGDCAD